MTLRACIAGLALAASPWPAAAQNSTATSSAAASVRMPAPGMPCFARLPSTDSVSAVVRAHVQTVHFGEGTAPRLPLWYLNAVLDEIATGLAVANGLEWSVYSVSSRTDANGDTAWMASPAISARFTFDVDTRGNVSDLMRWGSTLNGMLEDRAQAAILAADAARRVPPLPPEVPAEQVTLQLVIARDSLPAPVAMGDLVPRSEQVPLFRAQLPVVRVNTPPRPVTKLYFEYPASAARLSVSDTVQVRFVVSEGGRVLPPSIAIGRASYREFAAEVVDVLDRTTFTPAVSGSCPIRTVVHLPVHFEIR